MMGDWSLVHTDETRTTSAGDELRPETCFTGCLELRQHEFTFRGLSRPNDCESDALQQNRQKLHECPPHISRRGHRHSRSQRGGPHQDCAERPSRGRGKPPTQNAPPAGPHTWVHRAVQFAEFADAVEEVLLKRVFAHFVGGIGAVRVRRLGRWAAGDMVRQCRVWPHPLRTHQILGADLTALAHVTAWRASRVRHAFCAAATAHGFASAGPRSQRLGRPVLVAAPGPGLPPVD